jgi:hypothetical protein
MSLKIENSRRDDVSRPVCVGLYLKYSQRINYTCYAKKDIDKNVDHMNVRKISLFGSVKERFIQYSINLSTVTFGLFKFSWQSCIIS